MLVSLVNRLAEKRGFLIVFSALGVLTDKIADFLLWDALFEKVADRLILCMFIELQLILSLFGRSKLEIVLTSIVMRCLKPVDELVFVDEGECIFEGRFVLFIDSMCFLKGFFLLFELLLVVLFFSFDFVVN